MKLNYLSIRSFLPLSFILHLHFLYLFIFIWLHNAEWKVVGRWWWWWKGNNLQGIERIFKRRKTKLFSSVSSPFSLIFIIMMYPHISTWKYKCVWRVSASSISLFLIWFLSHLASLSQFCCINTVSFRRLPFLFSLIAVLMYACLWIFPFLHSFVYDSWGFYKAINERVRERERGVTKRVRKRGGWEWGLMCQK